MTANNLSVTLTARAVDEVSPTMKKIEGAVKGLPEQIGKVSGMMQAFGGATGALAGPVGKAAGVISNLASSFASGGPLGAGLAAVNLAIQAGAAAWAAYEESAKAVDKANADAQHSLDNIIAGYSKQTADVVAGFADIERAIRNVGKTAREATISENELKISSLLQGVANLEDSNGQLADQLERVYTVNGHVVESEEGRAFIEKQMSEAELERVRTMQTQLEFQLRVVAERYKNVDALQMESEKLRTLDTAEKAHTASVRASKDAADEARRAEKERLDDLTRATREAFGKAFGQQSAYYGRVADLAEADAKWREKQDEEATKTQIENTKRNAAVVSSVADAWGEAFGAMASGSQSAAKAMTIAMIRSVQTIIMAYAAEAAAAAYKDSVNKFGIYGIAIGAAFASAAFAAIISYVSKANFAFGGTVTGGVRGRDSVPAMLMPDEEVLPVGEARRYREARARGTLYGIGDGRAGSTTVVVAPQVQTFSLPGHAETKRWILKTFKRPFEQMVRDGTLRLEFAR